MASVPLWRSSAYLEEKAGAVGKARAVLEQARLKNPKQDQLWLAAVRTELRSGNTKAADALMAKALQVSQHSSKRSACAPVLLSQRRLPCMMHLSWSCCLDAMLGKACRQALKSKAKEGRQTNKQAVTSFACVKLCCIRQSMLA